jgi:endoglucanase
VKAGLKNCKARMFHSALSLIVLLSCTAAAGLLSSAAAHGQGTGYWHTHGSQILDARGNSVRIAGINWFGFETTDEMAHGLWTQDYHRILHGIKAQGFNTLRLPFSNQMVERPITPMPVRGTEGGAPARKSVNVDLAGLNSLQIMDRIIAAAGNEGLRVILDNQRSEDGDGNEANGLWYTAEFPETRWIGDWQALASRYGNLQDANGDPIVIGIDLRNEPYALTGGAGGSCWTGDRSRGGCPAGYNAHNWPSAAERAGNAIHKINPNLLMFVEGVDCYDGSCGWQGSNLEGAGRHPVTLAVSDRVVYSAHDYGPDLYRQSWFNQATTQAGLEAVWMKMWAYLSVADIAPVWLGAFATTNESGDIQSAVPGSQGQWFSSLVTFLIKQPRIHWAYWAANSEVDSGMLADNYAAAPASRMKQQALASIQFQLRSVQLPPVIAGIPEVENDKNDDGHLAGAIVCISAVAAGLLLAGPRTKKPKRRLRKASRARPVVSQPHAAPIKIKVAAPERRAQSCTTCGAKV